MYKEFGTMILFIIEADTVAATGSATPRKPADASSSPSNFELEMWRYGEARGVSPCEGVDTHTHVCVRVHVHIYISVSKCGVYM